MTQDAWPSPDSPPGPLPRIEDLPIADQGYEQEAVRAAFDAFYRHAAQLDATLRALDAVEVFRRDADALRNDLRALRGLGFGGGLEPSWTLERYEVPRATIPGAVVRLAAEAVLIVAVAVIAGVSHFRTLVTVALMAAAFVIVTFSEWLAARGRFVPPPAAFLPAAPEWTEPAQNTEPEALTIVEAAAEPADAAALDPWERGADAYGVELEPDLAERGGLFRRRRR
jgi:hypothetical protein